MIVAGAAAEPYLERRLEGIWPAFLLHDAISNRCWDRLYTDFPDFQFLLVEDGEVLAEGNCAPVRGMPAQWRDALVNAFEGEGKPDRVCALAIMVSPAQRSRGLSSVMLGHMLGLAAGVGDTLVAPVRPTHKERHPQVPIEEYADWRREDGTHVDPWIRTHERVGGRIVGTAEGAMVIEGPVARWREWTGLEFPADGEYVVPGALVPVRVEGGLGIYSEPCVWLEHSVR